MYEYFTHASWGMDEKWLIVYPQMNEMVSLTLTLLLKPLKWLLTLTLFPTPLSGFSPFSWWPLILHFSKMTSLLSHHHLQHVYSFPPLLLHSTRFNQCWSLCHPHVAPAIFAQMVNLRSFVRSLWCCLQSYFHLWLLQALSHRAITNNLGY
jgi:hypothetical protein